MPKVSVANEPLLERLIFAYDGANYRVVKCDASGNLVAGLVAGSSIEVTQDTPADLQATVTLATGSTIEATQDTAADLKATVTLAAGSTIEATQDTAADLKATVSLAADQNVQARSHGWINSAWQKNPLLLGYSGDKTQVVSNLAASAGSNTLIGDSVPAGEVWIVQSITAINTTSAPTGITLYCVINSVIIVLSSVATPGANTYIVWTGAITLAEGDQVRAEVAGCTAGDDIYLYYHAVRVDIDQ